MGHTDDKDRANMHHSTLKCKMSIEAGGQTNDAVLIPILQNSKVVKEGEELLVFDEKLFVKKQKPLSLLPSVQCQSPRNRLDQPNQKRQRNDDSEAEHF